MKYVFILTMWLSGEGCPMVYVVDFGLTSDDCIARLESYAAADPDMSQGVGSCEIDSGEPWDELPASGLFMSYVDQE